LKVTRTAADALLSRFSNTYGRAHQVNAIVTRQLTLEWTKGFESTVVPRRHAAAVRSIFTRIGLETEGKVDWKCSFVGLSQRGFGQVSPESQVARRFFYKVIHAKSYLAGNWAFCYFRHRMTRKNPLHSSKSGSCAFYSRGMIDQEVCI
jgi:hypothetical protein